MLLYTTVARAFYGKIPIKRECRLHLIKFNTKNRRVGFGGGVVESSVKETNKKECANRY